MPNNPTKYSIQELKNLSADFTVSPPMPREGFAGVDGTGAYRVVKTDTDGNLQVDVLSGGGSPPTSSTTTVTVVSDTASSTTILASNANRLGATVENDSSAVLYLLLGSGTASSTNYTVRMIQYSYYEIPYNYTGQINGIWASDPNDGGARVTELT